MHPQAVQILETALALQRAPGERFRLRELPLPRGLVHVLEVASGAPTSVAEAAAALGAPEQDVLDATRFYLEQVLFASPDADAYRILGVAPDAGTDEIRTHHRWLQRWLHPDRARAGDASVYATRVNQAWARLRTPALRHEYDVSLAEARLAGSSAPVSGATLRHWQFEDAPALHGRRSRWLFGAALSACAVLAVLIIRHEEPAGTWDPEAVAAGVDDAATDAIEQPVVPPLAEALASRPVSPPAPIRSAVPPPLPEPRQQAAPVRVAEAVPDRKPEPKVAVATIAPAPQVRIANPVLARQVPVEVPRLEVPKAVAVSLPAPLEPAAPPPPTAGPSPEAGMLLERMHKAEQRVAQLTAYLAAQPDAAPLWNDVQTQTAAERVRDRIAGSHGARLELTEPNWQLQPETATFSAGYRCTGCRVRQGRLDVKLVWRAGFWLVRGVDLAPAA